MRESRKFYGIYRGTVDSNIDPWNMGRLIVTVPDVGSFTPNTWAMPMASMAGKQQGTFMVPQIGAGVWVQYEAGDPDRPVWTGCWWGDAAEVPALALAGVPGNPNIVIQSTLQHAIVVSDLPGPTGGIMLKSPSGATIILNETGISIQNGQGASIVMAGPTITINNGALVVT